MNNEFYISTDKEKLDIKLIHDFLNNDSYWAKGRSEETIRKSIDNSLCFGVYKGSQQIGFARVVTDYAVLAWILDVFILKEFRKQALGVKLLESIMNHSELQKLQRWGLATDDAHGLYKKFGFELIKRPEIFMEYVSTPS
jgi:GNAT superfamily N-acetyltransferase